MKSLMLVLLFASNLSGQLPPIPPMLTSQTMHTAALTEFLCDEGPADFYRPETFRSPNFGEIEAHELMHVKQMKAWECGMWHRMWNENRSGFRKNVEAQAYCATIPYNMAHYNISLAAAEFRAARYFLASGYVQNLVEAITTIEAFMSLGPTCSSAS